YYFQGKIYVGKFRDNSITEDDIRSHFTHFGNVVDIQRPVDRSNDSEPKNFCFVTFDKEEPAEQLLKERRTIVCGQDVEIKKVNAVAAEVAAVGAAIAPWMGRYDPWGGGGGGGGYDESWGYSAPTPWAGNNYGGGGGGGGGGWNNWKAWRWKAGVAAIAGVEEAQEVVTHLTKHNNNNGKAA
ncbi:RNA-binding protein squid, partial [Caligus rogercresseyi]